MSLTLREVLQQARPSWTLENLDAVESRLAQVDIETAEALAAALRQQLNEKLRQAGLKTFTADTVRDLRQVLGLRSRPRPSAQPLPEDRQPDVASEASDVIPAAEPRPAAELRRERPGWREALGKASDAAPAAEPRPAAEQPRERPRWREALGKARAAQDECPAGDADHAEPEQEERRAAPPETESKEEPTPSEEAERSAGRRDRPSWMKALRMAKRPDEGSEEPEEKHHARVSCQKLPDKGKLSASAVAVEEATGSTAATEDEAESSGDDVIDVPDAEAERTEQAPPEASLETPPPLESPRAAAPRAAAPAPRQPEQSEDELEELPRSAKAAKSALSWLKDRRRNEGDHEAHRPQKAKEVASDQRAGADRPSESWYNEGQRLREKLKAARVAVPAAAPEAVFGGDDEMEDEGSMPLCAGCGLWPASSDPTDDGGGYCDNCWFKWEGPLRMPPTPKQRQVVLVRTAKDQGLRLSKLPPLPLKPGKPRPGDVTVTLDPSVRFQTFLGFGGAFTETSAKVLQKLSSENQEQIINACFREDSGLGYCFGRLHMTSCDFSDGNWSCCDKPYDMHLKTFTVEPFEQAIFPMIRRAEAAYGKPLKLLASPWSPPAWMKASGKMCKKADKMLPEYLDAWARYFVRFAEELQEQRLPLWGFTVQNEPDNLDAAWETCAFSAEEERDFIRFYLGPAMESAGFAEEPRIIAWDHNRDKMVERARVIYEEPDAAKYVWGVGFHWYEWPRQHVNVQYVHDMYPAKHLIFTEGCMEEGVFLGDWRLGEIYGGNILKDLNHWTEAWIDWNLVLDQDGGPNHKDNYCSAPVIADTERDCVYFQPSYYYIGHFSRHVKPGAVRISCVVRGPLNGYEDLGVTAFANPDGTVVLIALNMGDESVDFTLCIGGSTALASAPEHSITTFTLLDGPYPMPVRLGATPSDPPELDTYFIAGSWDDWKGVDEMAWDEDNRCFHYQVQLTSQGWESFRILVGGHWKTVLYPDEADGCHHSGSTICGPDDYGHGKNWTIGVHPLDFARAGTRYKVRLFLGPDNRPERVDWLRLGVASGFP